MRVRRRVFGTLLLGCWLVGLGSIASAEPAVTWQGTYVVSLVWADGNPVRLGTETRRYFPAEFEGQQVQGFESISKIALSLQGFQVDISQSALSYATLDHDPLYLESSMAGGAGQQKTIARFAPGVVRYERAVGAGEPTTGECPVPEGISLRDPDITWDPAGGGEGSTATAWVFHPETLRLGQITLTVAGRESVEVGGLPREAWRIETDDELSGPATRWVDEAGMAVREVLSVQGMQFVIELAEGGEQGAADAPPADVTEAPDLLRGSLVDCGGQIPEPRDCRRLEVRVSGLDRERLFLSSPRQRYEGIERDEAGGLGSLLTVTSEAVPEAGSPIGEGIPEEVRPYLAATETIQSGDKAIAAQAREIVGAETDSWKAARAIGNWVVGRMTPSLSEGLLRSAKEVFDNPKGECRSYSALTAALCRAAGIPCRVVAGAVYLGDALGSEGLGKFGFHAWCEVWVGEWIALDTAFPGPQGIAPVDATHIKFAEGDIADMVSAARVVRSLQLELVGADTLDARPAEEEEAARWRDAA